MILLLFFLACIPSNESNIISLTYWLGGRDLYWLWDLGGNYWRKPKTCTYICVYVLIQQISENNWNHINVFCKFQGNSTCKNIVTKNRINLISCFYKNHRFWKKKHTVFYRSNERLWRCDFCVWTGFKMSEICWFNLIP